MPTSLIVTLLTASLVLASPVKYLGLVSPSLFPLRTALDVFQPGPALGFPFRLAGYPGLLPRYLPHPFPLLPSRPLSQPLLPANPPVEGVDVAEEVVGEGVAP